MIQNNDRVTLTYRSIDLKNYQYNILKYVK